MIILKFGRRYHSNILNNVSKEFLLQKSVWHTIKTAMKAAEKKCKKYRQKHYEEFWYKFYKYKEEDENGFIIEWYEMQLIGTDELEEEEYKESLELFKTLEKSYVYNKEKNEVKIDDEKLAKRLSTQKVKKYMRAGYNALKKASVAKSLNKLGIIALVEKREKNDNRIEKSDN